MINKKKLWYLTLFSLILILGIYYVTMPEDLLEKANSKIIEKTDRIITKKVQEEDNLTAMRVSLEEERQEKMDVLQEQLTNEKLTNEEKNNAYEQIKYLNEVQGKEENFEKKLKKELGLNCFTKIDNNNVSVVCVSSKHDVKLANSIMRMIQKNYNEKMNVSVKFQKT